MPVYLGMVDGVEYTAKDIRVMKERIDALEAECIKLENDLHDTQQRNYHLQTENERLDAHAKRWGLQAQKAEAQVRQLQWVLEDMAKP